MAEGIPSRCACESEGDSGRMGNFYIRALCRWAGQWVLGELQARHWELGWVQAGSGSWVKCRLGTGHQVKCRPVVAD